MFKNLSPRDIGAKTPLVKALELAKLTGFDGLEIDIVEVSELVERHSIDYVKDLFNEAAVKLGGWWLPMDCGGEEEEYQHGLDRLDRLAQIAEDVGCTRVLGWIWPFSDERSFEENFRWHLKRFRPVVEVLKDHGCRLGIEFVGPKTSRSGHKYEFIHAMEGTLRLCDALSAGTAGLLLDSWHWYTSHGTLDDLKKLASNQVVYVHLADAPAGVPVDEQIDNVRCLPGETGVIDLVGFLSSLNRIGYDGPVTPEPFSKTLKGMNIEEAARTTALALDKVWRAARIA